MNKIIGTAPKDLVKLGHTGGISSLLGWRCRNVGQQVCQWRNARWEATQQINVEMRTSALLIASRPVSHLQIFLAKYNLNECFRAGYTIEGCKGASYDFDCSTIPIAIRRNFWSKLVYSKPTLTIMWTFKSWSMRNVVGFPDHTYTWWCKPVRVSECPNFSSNPPTVIKNNWSRQDCSARWDMWVHCAKTSGSGSTRTADIHAQTAGMLVTQRRRNSPFRQGLRGVWPWCVRNTCSRLHFWRVQYCAHVECRRRV